MLNSIRTAIIVLFCGSFLLGCNNKNETDNVPVSVSADDTALIISERDTRLYRPLVLSNGLRVLLISDPETNKAAVSLNVDVGSGADPKGREGLAHFVEHMLFLGTEKYPEADAYQRFISENGGGHNAYTAFEDTNYFFDIEPNQLEQGLDRFSQFFVAPLFSQQYLERERNAVHSEYKAKINNEMRRFLDVFKTQLNPAHPYSKFSVGTLETLQTQGLAEAVKQFYTQYYHADNMSLVVLGQEPLDTLNTWVQEKFREVPKGGDSADEGSFPPLFKPDDLPKHVSIKPLQNTRSLSLNFPIPDLSSQRLNKPTQLVGHLFGHEGEGSLFALLKRQGWAESLSAGVFMDTPGGALFSVNIQLTPDGLKHQDDIVGLVFTTQKTIVEGIEAWRYQELSTVSKIQFNNKAKAPAQNYVRTLAAQLDDYEQPYWLSGSHEMQSYDEVFIQAVLSAITPDNMALFISDPSVDSEQRSPWYNVAYTADKPTLALLKRWQLATHHAQIYLPSANPYVPTSFELHTHDKPHQQLVSTGGFDAWLVTDDSLQEPRAFSQAYLSNSQWGQSAEHVLVAMLAAKLINDDANRDLYEAKSMGYSASIWGGAQGLGISAYGFDQKLPIIVERLVEQYKQLNWTAADFTRAKSEVIRQLENQALEPAYVQLHGRVRQMLMSTSWSREAMIKAVEALTFERFLTQWQVFTKFDHLAVLMAGNIAEQQQQALMSQWQRLAPKNSDVRAMPQPDVADVASGVTTVRFAVKGEDSAVNRYYRSPVDGIKGRALAALTVQLLESGFYHEVRTEKQFGYIVYLANSLLYKTPGVVFVVQSPTYSGDEIAEAIEIFVSQQVAGKTKALDNDAFETVKQSLIHNLTRPSTRVVQLGERAWRNYQHGVTSFDEAKMIANVLKSIDLAEWENYKLRLFGSETKQQIDFIAEKTQ